MSNEDAYIALALNNTQSELSELEIGLHAPNSGLSGSEYAWRAGVPQTTLADKVKAARVLNACALDASVAKQWRCLAEIHAAPKWLWRALVARMAEKGWTVEQTRAAVGRDLIEVKEALGHGNFMTWTKQVFPKVRHETLTRWMNAAEMYGREGKFEIISNLGNTVMQLLAAPSTPEEVRTLVEIRALAGENFQRLERLGHPCITYRCRPPRTWAKNLSL